MKYIYRILIVVFCTTLNNCSDDNDGRFNSEPEKGWVDFRTSSTAVSTNTISIPLDVNVPVFPEGLNISYTIQNVSGSDFSDLIGRPSGTVFADPSDETRNTRLVIPLIVDIENDGNSSPSVFDITLTAVDKQGVRVGIDANSILTHRVTIDCVNSDIIPSDFFVGGYSIADVDANVGPGNGSANFAGETGNKVELTVNPSNPNERIFNATILPGIRQGTIPVTITFTTNDAVTLGTVNTGLSCDGANEYVYAAESVANSATWNICDDESIIITYVEDPNGSCGGPFMSSFSLTKN